MFLPGVSAETTTSEETQSFEQRQQLKQIGLRGSEAEVHRKLPLVYPHFCHQCKSVGEGCEDYLNCDTGRCHNHVCKEKVGYNSLCARDRDCQSDNCKIQWLGWPMRWEKRCEF